MASPQKENGWTAIANEILEEVARREFTGREWSVLLVVWRETWGVRESKGGQHRKQAELPAAFIAKRTGIRSNHVRELLRSLVDNRVLTVVQPASFRSASVYAFQKDYDYWRVPRRKGPMRGPVDGPSAQGRAEGPEMVKERARRRAEGPGPEADNHRASLAKKETMKETMIPPTPQRGDGEGDRVEEERVQTFIETGLPVAVRRIEKRLAVYLPVGGVTIRQREKLREFLAAAWNAGGKRGANALDEAITETLLKLEAGEHVTHPVGLTIKRAAELLAQPEPDEVDYPLHVTPPERLLARAQRDLARLRARIGDREPDEITARMQAEYEADIARYETEIARKKEVPPSA